MRMLTLVTTATMMFTTAAVAQSPADALRPGDMLRVRIYLEPEMSGEFPVNEHGVVSLPRLGDLAVGEWPADSIRPRIARGYAEFLREPVVEVTLLRRVAVFGAVAKPGLYPVDPTMTVQEALALAGGASADGRRDRVDLIRAEGGTITLSLADDVQRLGIRSGDQLYVPQRSWISRNSWLVGSLLGAVATITAVLVN
jgi:polysaccharide export outer membrane protein